MLFPSSPLEAISANKKPIIIPKNVPKIAIWAVSIKSKIYLLKSLKLNLCSLIGGKASLRNLPIYSLLPNNLLKEKPAPSKAHTKIKKKTIIEI
jgi:hypothetical protein